MRRTRILRRLSKKQKEKDKVLKKIDIKAKLLIGFYNYTHYKKKYSYKSLCAITDIIYRKHIGKEDEEAYKKLSLEMQKKAIVEFIKE